MSFGEAIKSVFLKYATFSGRACRSEFWYFILFDMLVKIALLYADKFMPFSIPITDTYNFQLLSTIWSLGVLVPLLAVGVRRLHDIGRSGWSLLLPVLPYVLIIVIIAVAYFLDSEADKWIGSIVILGIITLVLTIRLIIWFCRDSQPGTNEWGPNPKEHTESVSDNKNY